MGAAELVQPETVRDLTGRWVRGWCVSRRVTGRALGRGWWVDVASESRRQERFLADPSEPELRRGVEQVRGRADLWLTVTGGDGDRIRAATSSLVPVYRRDALMAIDLTDLDATPAPPHTAELVLRVREGVALATAQVDGVAGASGQVAVLGRDAVVDRVQTEPALRRRGLGRLLVDGLCRWARARGADTGLLAASVEGQRLYTALGWRHVAVLRTYAGAPPPRTVDPVP